MGGATAPADDDHRPEDTEMTPAAPPRFERWLRPLRPPPEVEERQIIRSTDHPTSGPERHLPGLRRPYAAIA